MSIRSSNIKIAENWFRAFNEHDLEGLLALYDDHALHYSPKLKLRSPETRGFVEKKQNLKAWWKDAFDRIPSLRYEIKNIVASEDYVFMEYVRHASGDNDLNVCEVLQVKEGRIISSKVYHG